MASPMPLEAPVMMATRFLSALALIVSSPSPFAQRDFGAYRRLEWFDSIPGFHIRVWFWISFFQNSAHTDNSENSREEGQLEETQSAKKLSPPLLTSRRTINRMVAGFNHTAALLNQTGAPLDRHGRTLPPCGQTFRLCGRTIQSCRPLAIYRELGRSNRAVKTFHLGARGGAIPPEALNLNQT